MPCIVKPFLHSTKRPKLDTTSKQQLPAIFRTNSAFNVCLLIMSTLTKVVWTQTHAVAPQTTPANPITTSSLQHKFVVNSVWKVFPNWKFSSTFRSIIESKNLWNPRKSLVSRPRIFLPFLHLLTFEFNSVSDIIKENVNRFKIPK